LRHLPAIKKNIRLVFLGFSQFATLPAIKKNIRISFLLGLLHFGHLPNLQTRTGGEKEGRRTVSQKEREGKGKNRGSRGEKKLGRPRRPRSF
jgi:hypothetical protein